jgi:hypothetical protein
MVVDDEDADHVVSLMVALVARVTAHVLLNGPVPR